MMTQYQSRPITPLGILTAELGTILQEIKSGNISDSVIASLTHAYQLAEGLTPYLSQYSQPESEALKQLADKTASEDWGKLFSDGETPQKLEREMLSGHIEGQMLKFFVKMLRAKTVLEIGMFTGYSALAMAEALPDDGKVITCEVDNYVASFAQNCFSASPHGYKIQVEVAPALDTLRRLADLHYSFDLVFIDASKKEYIDYFRILLDSQLLQPNGLIVVDNTLYQGEVYLSDDKRSDNGSAIALFNQIVAEDERVEQVILPLRDGLTLIRLS